MNGNLLKSKKIQVMGIFRGAALCSQEAWKQLWQIVSSLGQTAKPHSLMSLTSTQDISYIIKTCIYVFTKYQSTLSFFKKKRHIYFICYNYVNLTTQSEFKSVLTAKYININIILNNKFKI